MAADRRSGRTPAEPYPPIGVRIIASRGWTGQMMTFCRSCRRHLAQNSGGAGAEPLRNLRQVDVFLKQVRRMNSTDRGSHRQRAVMAELNHFAISAALGSVLGPKVRFHHGQFGSSALSATVGALLKSREGYINDLSLQDDLGRRYEKAVIRVYRPRRSDSCSAWSGLPAWSHAPRRRPLPIGRTLRIQSELKLDHSRSLPPKDRPLGRRC